MPWPRTFWTSNSYCIYISHNCSHSIFDRVFQYKIATQILPTNDYLKRYQVKDTNICEKCDLEFDSIDHSLYSCSQIVPVLSNFFQFLKKECNISVEFDMVQYLLGYSGNENFGLNQVLLELKKAIFYSWGNNMDCNTFLNKWNIMLRKQWLRKSYWWLKTTNIWVFLKNGKNFSQFMTFWDPTSNCITNSIICDCTSHIYSYPNDQRNCTIITASKSDEGLVYSRCLYKDLLQQKAGQQSSTVPF